VPATQQSRRVGGSATSRQPGECAARDYSRSPSPSMPVNKGFHSPSSAWRIRGRSSSGGVQRRASAARSSSAERSSPSLSLAAPCIDQRRIISVVTKPPFPASHPMTRLGEVQTPARNSRNLTLPEETGRDGQRRALSLTQCADDCTFDQSSSSLSFSPLSSASSFLLGSWAMTFAAVRAGVAPFARSALHTRAWIRTRKPDLNWLSCFMP